MSGSLDYKLRLAGMKPKRITLLTSGTGVYTPTADNALLFVRVQGGGGGGVTAGSAGGGGGGFMAEDFIRASIAGIAYSVGAGGGPSVDGSVSVLGNIRAVGGLYDTSTGGGYGGCAGLNGGSANGTVVTTATAIVRGVAGGAGGSSSTSGLIAGQPVNNSSAVMTTPLSNYLNKFSNGVGNQSGGNSFYGVGGAAQTTPAAGNYGAGGGGGASPGSGLGGCIEIWDYGTLGQLS